MRRGLLPALFVLAACGGEADSEPLVDAGRSSPDADVRGSDAGASDAGTAAPDAGPSDPYELADALYEDGRLLEVRIEIAPGDWDALRRQRRDVFEILGDSCGEGPALSPFTYFPAVVTIDGTRLEGVGVRKKGFLGSLDEVKPSLKIELDRFADGQKLSGLERLTLNNDKQDPGHLNQCLGYGVLRAAGVPAPRCNFAAVSVNGQALGVYSNVEPIKKPFLRRHFGSDDGDLYEGTLSDLRDGWMATFEQKTDPVDPAQTDLNALAAAAAADDAALMSRLEAEMDLDGFFPFWAAEVLLVHGDGYSGNCNNFYLYRDPADDRFRFIPWGIDQLLNQGGATSVVRTRSVLTQRLFAHDVGRARYVEAMRSVLASGWDRGRLLDEIDRWSALIRPHLRPGTEAAFDERLVSLRAIVEARARQVEARLDLLTAADAEPLMEPLCFDRAGTVQGTFQTTWGQPGDADVVAVLDGQTFAFQDQVAISGPDEQNPGKAVVGLIGVQPDGGRALLYMAMPDAAFAAGTFELAEAAFALIPPGAEEPDRVFPVSGTLVLHAAAPAPGAPVAGSVDVAIWRTPFM